MRQSYKRMGYFNIYVLDKNSKKIKKKDKVYNLITNACLTSLAKAFVNQSPDVDIRVLAIGDNNTTPVATNTALNNEVFRTLFVDQNTTGVGEVTTEFYILDSDYSGTIEEIGIFAGYYASLTPGSGTLISHALWSYSKSSSEEIYIERVDSIS